MTRGQFIDKFILLEKLLRQLAEEYELSMEKNNKYRTIPLHEIIRGLSLRQVINRNQMNALLEVNKIRNLAVHGEISNVESQLGDWVDKLIENLKYNLEN